MGEPSFEERVLLIVQKDSRYHAEAYHFLLTALRYSQFPDYGRHVSATELLDRFRRCALSTFGPAARRKLAAWGLQSSRDVGEVVRNLIAAGCLRQAPEDRLDDFESGYDFVEAFPEAKASPAFRAVLCHLVFERNQLDDFSSRLSRTGGIDLDWIASLRLDPFIENCEPTLDQVGTFHQLIEDVRKACEEARFGEALRLCEQFARRAAEWQPKPDFLIHDFLVLVEPYCPDLIEPVLNRFHLTPNAPPEFGEDIGYF